MCLDIGLHECEIYRLVGGRERGEIHEESESVLYTRVDWQILYRDKADVKHAPMPLLDSRTPFLSAGVAR